MFGNCGMPGPVMLLIKSAVPAKKPMVFDPNMLRLSSGRKTPDPLPSSAMVAKKDHKSSDTFPKTCAQKLPGQWSLTQTCCA